MLTWPSVDWFCSAGDQKSHKQWKVRCCLPALRAESVQQGWRELAQGKNQKVEEQNEEGRLPSSVVANCPFKPGHSTFHLIVPTTWKGASSILSDFRGRWAHTPEGSRVWCEESWQYLSLLFSPHNCPFPFSQHFLFLRRVDPPGLCPQLRK